MPSYPFENKIIDENESDEESSEESSEENNESDFSDTDENNGSTNDVHQKQSKINHVIAKDDPSKDNEALLQAAKKGSTDVVKKLLADGANVRMRDDEALRPASGKGPSRNCQTPPLLWCQSKSKQ